MGKTHPRESHSGLRPDRLYVSDALEGLRQLSDESVDLVITDPPYNVASSNKKTIQRGWVLTAMTLVGRGRVSTERIFFRRWLCWSHPRTCSNGTWSEGMSVNAGVLRVSNVMHQKRTVN